MKSKRKLDSKAIKQFFIDHTEKIVMGVVGLLFLYFTYSAVMLQANESYKKEPKTLSDAVQAAQKTMVTGPLAKTPASEAPITAYASEIERFKMPENPGKYKFDAVINPAVIAQKNPRGTPAVIPVEELRAVAGRGALSGNSGAAGTVGQRWVVVTGLVPYAKQLDEYKKNFQTAGFEGNHDTPEYVGFLVQRTEVVPGAASEPNWDKAVTICNATFLNHQLEKWTGASSEVVDAKYLLPGLASQLPPRTTGEWGDEVAHPAEIKLIPKEERDKLLGGGAAQALPNQTRGRESFRIPPGRGEGSYGRGPRRPPPGTIRPGSDQGGVDDIFGDNTGIATDETANKSVDEAAQIPPNYLLRYFDFDVEPGKLYAYRVYLLLRNPNYDLPESVLFDPKQHSQKLLSVAPGKDRPDANNKVTDWQIVGAGWSSTGQSTRLPSDNRLIAGTVEPAKSPSPAEITGQVRIIVWDKDTGANKWTEKASILRGTPIDSAFAEATWHPKSEDGTSSDPKAETNSVFVDVTGGEMLSPRDRDKSPHCPGAMIVLNENGELVIHEEMTEAKDWNDATKEPEQPIIGGGEFRHPGPRGRGGERPIPPPRGRPAPKPDSSLPDMAPGR